MKFYTISLRSLKRKKTKTFFLIFGLFVASASVVALKQLSESMQENLSKELDTYGANIVIVPKSEVLSLNYGGISLGNVSYSKNSISGSDLKKIREIKNKENISVISPKLVKVIEVDSAEAVVVGIRFEKELKLKKWWKIIGSVPAAENEALLGSRAAEKLQRKAGDYINLDGEDFIVSGTLKETGSQDDAMIFISLSKAQNIFDRKDEFSLVDVAALCYDCPIEEIVRQTSEKLPDAKVTAIRQTIDSRMAALAGFEKFSFGISTVILIISLLIVFVNINSSMNERIKEIGLYRAVGFTKIDVLKIILLEILIASFIAGITGYFAGISVGSLALPYLYGGESEFIWWNAKLILTALSISILSGIAISLLPIIRSANLDPTIAFRNL